MVKYENHILTWRLNRQPRHAGLDPASSVFMDSRLRGNDNRGVFNRRSNKLTQAYHASQKCRKIFFPALGITMLRSFWEN